MMNREVLPQRLFAAATFFEADGCPPASFTSILGAFRKKASLIAPCKSAFILFCALALRSISQISSEPPTRGPFVTGVVSLFLFLSVGRLVDVPLSEGGPFLRLAPVTLGWGRFARRTFRMAPRRPVFLGDVNFRDASAVLGSRFGSPTIVFPPRSNRRVDRDLVV